MARNFDGVNDRIDFASAVDNFFDGGGTLAMYLNLGSSASAQTLGSKSTLTEWVLRNNATPAMNLRYGFSTTAGQWTGSTTLTVGTWFAIVLTYNADAVGNDPLMYVNGAAETITENSAPVGTRTTDAAQNFVVGEFSGGTGDLNGSIGCLNFSNSTWTAEQVNRHRWWGRAGGADDLIHPFWTAKLANEGTAVADGTATGTTVTSLPKPAMRPGSAMMGGGAGW